MKIIFALLLSAGAASAADAPPRVFSGHKAGVQAVAFSPDGQYLASGAMDLNVALWAVKTGKLKKVLVGHRSAVTDLQFSPDGDYLASVDAKGIEVWKVPGGKNYKSLNGHSHTLFSVRFSALGEYLTAGGYGGVGVWTFPECELQKNMMPSERMKVTRSRQMGKRGSAQSSRMPHAAAATATKRK